MTSALAKFYGYNVEVFRVVERQRWNGIAVVFATGMATEFGKIAHLTQEIEEAPTPLQRELTYATRVITFISVGLPILLCAYLFLGLIEAVAAMSAYFYVLRSGGWNFGIAAIVVTQIANSLTSRTTKESLFRIGFFTNRYLIAGIAIEIVLILLVVYAPPLQDAFGTAPLGLRDWLFLLPFAGILLFADEVRKWVVRRREG